MPVIKTLVFTVNSKLTAATVPGQSSSDFFQVPSVASPYFVPTPTYGPAGYQPLPPDLEIAAGGVGGLGLGGIGIGGLPFLGPSPLDLQFGRISSIDYPQQVVAGRSFNIISHIIHRIAGVGTYSVRINLPTAGISASSEPVQVSHFGEGIVVSTITIPAPPAPTTVSGVAPNPIFRYSNQITGSLELLRVKTPADSGTGVSGAAATAASTVATGVVVDDSRAILMQQRGTTIFVDIPSAGAMPFLPQNIITPGLPIPQPLPIPLPGPFPYPQPFPTPYPPQPIPIPLPFPGRDPALCRSRFNGSCSTECSHGNNAPECIACHMACG